MNIHNLDLNLLRVFDALIQDRNVSAAAYRVSLSQPAMSNALARLRAVCDDPLFVRTKSGMEPTPFASDLAGPVREALAIISAGFEQGKQFDASSSTRQFKLVLSDIGAAVFLPPLMRSLSREAPGVRVSVLQIPHGELASAMEQGIAELAIGGSPSTSKGFYQQRLLIDNYVCAMRHDHPLAPKRLTTAAYAKASHVVPMPTLYQYRNLVLQLALAAQGIQRKVHLEVPHFLVLPMILESTDLIATVSHKLVRTILPPDRFTVKPLPFAVMPLEIKQIWHRRFHHDAGVRWLRNTLATHFAPEAQANRAAVTR